MTPVSNIPGVAELIGKGIYTRIPAELPQPVGDRHAVVIGERAPSARLAERLEAAGWNVRVANVRATELACATGIERLEAVVFRRIATGRIEACNASALFILDGRGRREQNVLFQPNVLR